jgi:hypothetical protein
MTSVRSLKARQERSSSADSQGFSMARTPTAPLDVGPARSDGVGEVTEAQAFEHTWQRDPLCRSAGKAARRRSHTSGKQSSSVSGSQAVGPEWVAGRAAYRPRHHEPSRPSGGSGHRRQQLGLAPSHLARSITRQQAPRPVPCRAMADTMPCWRTWSRGPRRHGLNPPDWPKRLHLGHFGPCCRRERGLSAVHCRGLTPPAARSARMHGGHGDGGSRPPGPGAVAAGRPARTAR